MGPNQKAITTSGFAKTKDVEIAQGYRSRLSIGKAVKIWNELSHQTSSPLKNTNISVEFINLIGLNGNYISKYNYTTRSIIDELESIKNDYLKLLPAFHDTKELVETI